MSGDLESLVDPYDYYQAMVSGSRAERVFHRARLKLIREVTPLTNKRILEVGSGSGCLAIPLRQQGHDVWAVEAGSELLTLLQEHSASCGVSLPAVQADARKLPFADNSFDIVIVASLVHMIPDPAPLLYEVERVCQPRGRLVIAGPWHRHPKASPWVKSLMRGRKAAQRRAPFTLEMVRPHLGQCRYLSSLYNYPIGYFATLWAPDKKPALSGSGPRARLPSAH